jgi:hypothetical protein
METAGGATWDIAKKGKMVGLEKEKKTPFYN